jgi:hypothetical protein
MDMASGRRVGGISLAVLVSATAAAQERLVWSEVDCARSRIVPVPGAICRGTNIGAGSEIAGGAGQRHSLRGDTPFGYVSVVVSEGITGEAHVLTLKSAVDYLKLVDERAAGASAWSVVTRYGDAEYATFQSSKGEQCVGFRKLGESRSRGYAWMMHGLLCAPKEETLQDAQMIRFIDDARLR